MSDVLYAAADGVATIALNRPARLNAMTEGLVEGVASALERAAADDAVRAILLRGEGRAFCAGDDLKEFEDQVRSAAGTHRYITRIQDTARMMVLGRKPVIERQRDAIGGAAELGDHVAVAVERTDDVAAAMHIKDRRVARRARRRGPFGRNAARADLLDLDIAGKAVGQTALVDVAAPLLVIGGTRPAEDLRAQRGNFRIVHRYSPRARD